MPLTDSLDAVTQYIFELMTAQKSTLGLIDVWYGEHQTIPYTPALTVEPIKKAVEVANTGHMARNDFTVALTLFHSRLTGGQVMMQECLQFAEAIESLLHTDKTLGGLVIYGYVGTITTGYATRNKVILKSAQLTFNSFSKTRMV